ncbi:efflux RND transporter permease subunit [Candidatus Uabimicrobium amorphum]|uniref:Acriflavin resistance protein n=1 Tax=Uabimicrobium amorphum TaxID=2596890 RepID=A0A5S9IKP1_UABAM|nr:efflux RND transporter permease subunit [Candidatus Uabimicrobium amorphum]BBM83297.1 acriflavin resistance protein [Candidatus Uabimicrobium amorphum]
MRDLIREVARHPVLPNLLMIVFLVAGFFGYSNLYRETFPPINIDMITVSVVYPGASSTEVEEGVLRQIERAIKGTPEIKNIESSASEGIAFLNLELKERRSRDTKEILQDVKSKIDKITTLPKDIEKPEVQEIIATDTVYLMVLHGDAQERVLREMALDIKDELFAQGLSQVKLEGIRDYEITIEVSEEKLRAYGITLQQISQIIQQSSVNLPAGAIRTKNREYKIEIQGRIYTGKNYENLAIVTKEDGTLLRLNQIAKVHDAFVEGKSIGKFNTKRAVLFVVEKTKEEDSIEVAKQVRDYIAAKSKELPPGMKLATLADFSKNITDRIQLLIKNGWQGLLLLFLCLWLFMNLRLSFWVTIGIPISFAFTGFVLFALGSSLNMINLFGLILVLGIVVDDAIVVGENIYRRQKEGTSMMEAAVDGTSEMSWPVIAAVSTTVLAFMPLFFVAGVLGKFISVLPLVVVLTLIGSLIESLFILPAHLGHGSPTKSTSKIRQTIDASIEYVIHRLYAPVYHVVLQYRYIAISLMFVIFTMSLSLVFGGFVKYIMFPEGDALFLKAEVAFPEGTPVSYTQNATSQIENAALSLNKKDQPRLVKSVYSISGEGKENTGSVYVTLVGPEKRNLHSKDILNLWRDRVGKIDYATSAKFFNLESSPGGKDIQIFLEGGDLAELQYISQELQIMLKNYQGVYDVKSDLKPGKQEMHVALKPYGRMMGITLQNLALQIRQGFHGLEALKIQRGRDEIKVNIKYPRQYRQHIIDLERIRIRTDEGTEIPFSEIATVEIKRGVSEILRRNSQRRVEVTAKVNKTLVTPQYILKDMRKNFLALEKKYRRVKIKTEGAQSENQRVVDSLVTGFVFGILGIYVILTLIFRSYLQPMLIMTTIPLGLIGAILGHFLLGYELTMLSFFGVVALSGVVVNDSLVLIEQINNAQRKGVNVLESVQKAGPLRFRAIILTSMTTVAGVTPLLTEQSFQAQFLKPMALSLAAGLIFATVIMLFIVPCFYLALNDIRRVFHWLKTGYWPTAEQVEPASTQEQH